MSYISKSGRVSWMIWAYMLASADLVSKVLAFSNLQGRRVDILPFLQLRYVENPGAAFGMFASVGAYGRVALIAFSVGASIALLVWLMVWPKLSRIDAAAASFMLAGAVGNAIDRVYRGYVIDYVHLHAGEYYWPTFNIADAALTVGVAILLIEALVRWKAESRRQAL